MYLSGILQALSARQSPHGLQPLSFSGTRWRTDDHASTARLAVPSYSMALNLAMAAAKLLGARRRGLQATGNPGVVRMWWVLFFRTSRNIPVGFIRSRNSSRRLSIGLHPAMTSTLGTDGGALRPQQEGGCACRRPGSRSMRAGPRHVLSRRNPRFR